MEPRTKQTYVDNEITRITRALNAAEVNSDEYKELLNRLESLQKIRQEEKPASIKPDTIVMAATNLIGILMIMKHEKFEIITTRAFNMLGRTV